MGLGGGSGGGTILGAGNPFTGTALALEYTGDHCFAYSGVSSIDGTEATQLEFTSSSHYIVADILFSSMSTDKQYLHKVYFNNSIVQEFVSWIGGGRRSFVIRVVMPAYTDVKCTSENITDNVASDQACSIVGRVYR